MITNNMGTAMDRRVKERLVGATILVALIVLIVPELLSGPHRFSSPPAVSLPAPTRNVSVDLATSKATPAPQAADLMPPTSEPPPAAARLASSPPSVTTLGAQAAAGPGLETRPPGAKSSLPGTAKSGMPSEAQSTPARDSWSVQLGSFSSKANADKLVHQLKARGLPAYVISSGSGTAARFKVRMGPLADRAAAQREVDKLKGAGHAATVVAPAS